MNNTKILVGPIDKYDPEVRAMLSAMYSRSYASIESRLPNTEESVQQHKEKLHKFYVGYGHRSVGQLATTDIFIEGVSMLAEKAIQNHPLYNGQSSSTRYINFSTQPMVSNSNEVYVWQEKFRLFYIKALPLTIEKIKAEYPLESQADHTSFTTWENTVKARAFDICRGLLPAGCTTNVAFSGTFDTINDHFGEMLYHPCAEMQHIAISVLKGLKEKYPHASIDIDKLKEQNSNINYRHFYQELYGPQISDVIKTVRKNSNYEDELKEHLTTRKKYQKASRFVSNSIDLSLIGEIDFGAYRDLHRHRNGVIGMEALSTKRGFHSFYIDSLPTELTEELLALLNEFEHWYENFDGCSHIYKQYAVPMGYKVGVDYSCDLNQALYIIELRSGKTVHQTLRELVFDWNDILLSHLTHAYGNVKIYPDLDKDNFTLRRGKQTFNLTENV